MTRRLLDRQVRLLEYLTSGDAIFRKNNAPLDPALQGIDARMLHIESRFSYEKRVEKIAAVFPKTFALLGTHYAAIIRAFSEACPPNAISRIENARQFHEFLARRWRQQPPVPPYLRDVSACELACATVRVAADAGSEDVMPPDARRRSIRRNPCVVLLRTAFDIRPLFEGGLDSAPVERETLLAIGFKSEDLQIFELTPDVFDLLAALDRWIALDELPGADSVIASLAEAGLLELGR